MELCRHLSVDDPPVFVDNDISAYSGKKRPGHLDLLERVKLGPSRDWCMRTGGGGTTTANGSTYTSPSQDAQLSRNERVIVDEAPTPS